MLLMVCAPLASACGAPDSCGPDSAVVARAIDGDTIELVGGKRVRYLLVDTPEITHGDAACFGAEARAFNQSLVEGRQVSLRYDSPCADRYGRLLAYVSLDGVEVNTWLVRGGYACVLHIPPSGNDRAAEFEALEQDAKRAGRGLWSACAAKPCG
ncbi:MAG: thermonuclease family protein [Myxococcota bacterium]